MCLLMEFDFDLENPLPHTNENFTTLFYIENDHMPSKTYTQSLIAMDNNLTIRRDIVTLIFDFSRYFDPFLAYLSINYLDRFLSSHSILDGKPWMFRLMAISCISLAMKMRKTDYSLSNLQQHDNGFVFDCLSIERMEMLILGALKWRMRSVNPFSFVNYFIKFFKFNDESSVQALKDRVSDIILKAQNDIKLMEFKPSVVSASALLWAAHELFPMQLASLRNGITNCSYVDKENLLKCYHLMQEVAMDGYGNYGSSVLDIAKFSCTPTYVLDLHCFSSSNSGISSNSSEVRGLKRQKIEGSEIENLFQL